jgi:hypothetical protein
MNKAVSLGLSALALVSSLSFAEGNAGSENENSFLSGSFTTGDLSDYLHTLSDNQTGLPIRGVSQHPVEVFAGGDGALVGGSMTHMLWPKAAATTGLAVVQSNENGTSDSLEETEQAAAQLIPMSTYDVQSVKRYCDSGLKMTERDWRFVSSYDIVQLTELTDVESCNPPGYSYKQYLTAYVRYCNGETLMGLDETIVARSGQYPKISISECNPDM